MTKPRDPHPHRTALDLAPGARPDAGPDAGLNSGMDSALICIWDNGGPRQIEITPDAQLHLRDVPWPYVLENGGDTLTFPGTAPLWQFTRMSGSGADVVGQWERFETDAAGTWREEWLWRADGSFTWHWSLDGSFDSEGIGSYSTSRGLMMSRERRARIATGPGDRMIIAQYFGPIQSGTHAIAADGNSWTFTTGGSATTYTRVN